MDIYDDDLVKFWTTLNLNNVNYIMVGGFAVNMHGFSRNTNDVDIWIKDTKANRINLGNAMEVFNYVHVDWKKRFKCRDIVKNIK